VTQKLNDALFAAKALYTPVAQGDEVLYRNQRLMVCATKADGSMVQLCPTEEGQTIDTYAWIKRADIDQKLAKKSRAMSSSETDVMTKVLQHAYDAAVLALKNDCTRFVYTDAVHLQNIAHVPFGDVHAVVWLEV
jgi:hypothetical protein